MLKTYFVSAMFGRLSNPSQNRNIIADKLWQFLYSDILSVVYDIKELEIDDRTKLKWLRKKTFDSQKIKMRQTSVYGEIYQQYWMCKDRVIVSGGN